MLNTAIKSASDPSPVPINNLGDNRKVSQLPIAGMVKVNWIIINQNNHKIFFA